MGIINLIYPQVFKYKKIAQQLPSLTIIIPVRDEVRILKKSSESLLSLNYPDLEILYYDDGSLDGSDELLRDIQDQQKEKIRLIKGNEPEKGWLGKNYACYSAASEAKGEYLLFIDADVVISNSDLLLQAISYMKEYKLEGLSLMPEQRSRGSLSKYLIPFIMQWPIRNFMPMKLVEMINISLFANGQFLLISKKSYASIAGHKSVKSSLIEDIALFKELNSQGYRVRTMFAFNELHSYMYEDLRSVIDGFSKNIYYVFGGNLLLFLIWQILLFSNLIPFFLLPFFKDALPLVLIILLSRLLMLSKRDKTVVLELLLFPVELSLLIVISWISIYRNIKKKVIWENRDVYSSSSTSMA